MGRTSSGRGSGVRSKLADSIEEIDALIASSERARKAVGERRERLVSQHREMERMLDRARLKSREEEADHALLFHLGPSEGIWWEGSVASEASKESSVLKQKGPPSQKGPASRPSTPADAKVPPAPAYASKTEARDWEEYYRFCARGALFSALDKCQKEEDELARAADDARANEDARRRDAAEEDCDVEAIESILAVEDPDLENLERTRIKAQNTLEKKRRQNAAELKARFAAYDIKPPTAPGHEDRLKELKINLPAPADLVAMVEAEARGVFSSARDDDRVSTDDRPAKDDDALPQKSGRSTKTTESPVPVTQKKKKRAKKPRGVAGAVVAAEMESVAGNDPLQLDRMQDLPADPRGAVDAKGRPEKLGAYVAKNTYQEDLTFPALDTFKRDERDEARYLMPDYAAETRRGPSDASEQEGGYWCGLRAQSRTTKLKANEDPPELVPTSLPPKVVPNNGKKKKKGHHGKKLLRGNNNKKGRRLNTHQLEKARDRLTALFKRTATPRELLTNEADARLLYGDDFKASTAACRAAVVSALGGSGPRPASGCGAREDWSELIVSEDEVRRVVASGLAALARSPVAKAVLNRAVPPTEFECDRFAARFCQSGPADFHAMARVCLLAAVFRDEASREAARDALVDAETANQALARHDISRGFMEDDIEPPSYPEDLVVFFDSKNPEFETLVASSRRAVCGAADELDALNAWRVVGQVADEAPESFRGNLDLADADDPDDGALQCLRVFTANPAALRLDADRAPAFVKFALIRAFLTSFVRERRCAAGVETAYRRLLASPPSNRVQLLEDLDSMVAEGVAPAATVALITSDHFHSKALTLVDKVLVGEDGDDDDDDKAGPDEAASAGASYDDDFEADEETKEAVSSSSKRKPTDGGWTLVQPALERLSDDLNLGLKWTPDSVCRFGARFLRSGPGLDASWRDRLVVFLTYASALASLEPHRAGRDLPDLPVVPFVDRAVATPLREEQDEDEEDEYDDEAPDAREPDLALARALRKAVENVASNGPDAEPDYRRAFEALAGRGAASLEPAEAVALLRPFALHHSGVANFDLTGSVAASRRIAILLAAANDGYIDARALRHFVDATSRDDPATQHIGQKYTHIALVSPEHFASLTLHRLDSVRWKLAATVLPGGHVSDLVLSTDALPSNTALLLPLQPSLLFHAVSFLHFQLRHPLALSTSSIASS